MESKIIDTINTLNLINYKMANLAVDKEALETELAKLYQHEHNGQVTYRTNKYAVTIRTPMNLKLDIKKYQELKSSVNYIPVVEKIKTTYEVEKALYAELTREQLMFVSDFITETPGKLSVTIKANV